MSGVQWTLIAVGGLIMVLAAVLLVRSRRTVTVSPRSAVSADPGATLLNYFERFLKMCDRLTVKCVTGKL